MLSPSEDWISLFMKYSEGIPSPEAFRLWSAIAAISGTMRRRIWIPNQGEMLHANLYVWLVAPPGTGKGIINRVHNLWKEVKSLDLAPHSMTKAALMDTLEESGKVCRWGRAQPEVHHFVTAAVEEFSVLCSEYDMNFLSALTKLYNCEPSFDEKRRDKERTVNVPNPGLMMLAGVQPKYLSAFLPEAAWGQGFMSRVLMIYQDKCPWVDPFADVMSDLRMKADLVDRLREIAKQVGPMNWTPQAQSVIREWWRAGGEPIPNHPRLMDYLPRRITSALKLSMISAISRGQKEIDARDAERALKWLFDAEATMPETFVKMSETDDARLLKELRDWVKQQGTVTRGQIYQFVMARTRVERVKWFVDAAISSNMVWTQGNSGDKFYLQ